MANCKRKRTIAAIMALAIVAGAAPAKPISDLIMPELSVSAAEASSSVSWNGFNVAAGGKLTAKFHVNVPDGFAYANTAYAKITCKDVTVEQTFKKIETKNGVKTFSIDLAAKQMTDDITCEIYANSTEKTPLLKTTQTVKGYAEFQLAQSATTAAEAKVYKAMLNYGGYAQIALDYNKTKLANADLSAADKSLASVTADKIGAEYKNVDVLKCEALGSFYAINATLESETELNVYFKPATGVAFNSVKFACTDGGKDYEVKAEEITEGTYKGLFKMKITGIAAKAIGKDLIISVQDSTVPTNVASYKCSVNTFIRSTLINGKEADKNAAAALYLYNQAAVDFFDAERTVDIAIQGPAYYINEYKDKNNAVVGTTKAFLETVGEDEEGNSIEKYLITVPANIADTYGVGRLNITYVNNNKTVTVDSKKCVVNYDDLSQTTVIAVEKDALPVDAEIVVTVTVSEKIDFTFTNPDKHLSLTNENAFKAEEFVTVLEAEEGYALPASITVKENGTIKDANKYYTYDSVTGEIVVFGPLDDLTIEANAVDSNQVSSLLTNLTSDVTFPVTVGDGFSTTLSVTDSSKYKVPKKVTLYGEEDLVEYYMEAEYDETSKKYVDTYYKWNPSANDNKGGWDKVEDSDGDEETTVRQEITEANAEKTSDGATTPAKPYYINNIKADGTAKLEVFNIDTDVVLVANAIEYYGVTVNTTSVASSASRITYAYDSKTGKYTSTFKTTDLPETVDKGTNYGPIYFALNTTDKDLILPTSITVKMNGKELKAETDYTWTTVDAVAVTNGMNGTETGDAVPGPAQAALTFLKEANGEVEITVAATEQCTVTTKAVYGVTFSNTTGTYSTGDFTTVIKPNSSYVLPDTIKVTLNDKALTAGVDYVYDVETGEVVVYGLAKGDKLYIEATGVLECLVETNDNNGAVKIEAVSGKLPTTIKTGSDFTCKITAVDPDTTDKFTSYGVAGIVVNVNDLPITTDSKNTTYYEFDKATGILTVHNVTGKLYVSANSAEVYTLTATYDNSDRDSMKGLENATFTIDNASLYQGYKNECYVTVSGIDSEYEIDLTTSKVYNSNNVAVGAISEAEDEDGETIKNVYKITVDDSANINNLASSIIKGDLKAVFTAVVATYELTDSAKNLTLVLKDGKGNNVASVDTGTSATITVGSDNSTYYAVPDPANVKVYMGGTLLENVYAIDKNPTTGALLDTATITIPKVTGDIEVVAEAKVAISATEAIDGKTDVVLSATYDSTNIAKTSKFYDPATGQAISIELAIADNDTTTDYASIKYVLDTISVTTADGSDEGADPDNLLTSGQYTAALTAAQSTLAQIQTLYNAGQASADQVKAASDAYEAARDAAYYAVNGSLVTVYNADNYVVVSATVKANPTTQTVATMVDGVAGTGLTAYEVYVGTTKCYEIVATGSNTSAINGKNLVVTRTVNGTTTTGKIEAVTVPVEGSTTPATVAYRISGFSSYDNLTITATTPASGS